MQVSSANLKPTEVCLLPFDLLICSGQIGFAVILILFFYYFALILILGAQINAHFLEKYPPLTNPLGTYVSQMQAEDPEVDACNVSSIANNEQQFKTTGWMSKLCSCKQQQQHKVQPQSEEQDHV